MRVRHSQQSIVIAPRMSSGGRPGCHVGITEVTRKAYEFASLGQGTWNRPPARQSLFPSALTCGMAHQDAPSCAVGPIRVVNEKCGTVAWTLLRVRTQLDTPKGSRHG